MNDATIDDIARAINPDVWNLGPENYEDEHGPVVAANERPARAQEASRAAARRVLKLVAANPSFYLPDPTPWQEPDLSKVNELTDEQIDFGLEVIAETYREVFPRTGQGGTRTPEQFLRAAELRSERRALEAKESPANSSSPLPAELRRQLPMRGNPDGS